MKAQILKMSLCLMILSGGLLIAESAEKEQPKKSEADVSMIHSEVALPDNGNFEIPLPPPPDGGPGIPGTFTFIAMELEDSNKLVKGAPYSAQAITEKTQNLADGNRIVRQNTASLYRDKDGRTRREQQFGALGFWVAEKDAPPTIFIHDPVAGVSYILDSKNQMAHKLMPKADRMKMHPPGGPEHAFGMKMQGPDRVFRFQHGAKNDVDQKTESLGKQMIEGVEAEGTRTTITIPAGEIGNELPILIVSERWYSSELQIPVLTKNSDPRFGETTYRVINIRKEDPDPSLFQVPAGYKIEN
jgi:hypothetical protein